MKHTAHVKALHLTVYGRTRREAQAKALRHLVGYYCGDAYTDHAMVAAGKRGKAQQSR